MAQRPTQIFECPHIEEKTAKPYVEYEFAFILAFLKGKEATTKALICKECWVSEIGRAHV